MSEKKGNDVLLAVSGKILAFAAREAVPFVLSILVRSGIRRYLKEKKEALLAKKVS